MQYQSLYYYYIIYFYYYTILYCVNSIKCPFIDLLMHDHDYAVRDIENNGKFIAYYNNYFKILTF